MAKQTKIGTQLFVTTLTASGPSTHQAATTTEVVSAAKFRSILNTKSQAAAPIPDAAITDSIRAISQNLTPTNLPIQRLLQNKRVAVALLALHQDLR